MAKAVVPALVKLTKAQWRAWTERNISRGMVTAKQKDFILGHTPPAQQKVGRLTTKHPEKGMAMSELMPIEDARKTFYQNPDLYTAGRGGPPAHHIKQAVPGEPADIGGGIGYQALKEVPVDTKRAHREFLMTTPAAEIMANDAHAQRLWAMMGGHRSSAGKIWRRFKDSSGQGKNYETAEDYFRASFLKWRETPKTFAKNHPREAKMLDQSWKVYGPGGTAPTPTMGQTQMPAKVAPRRYVGAPLREKAPPPKTILLKKGSPEWEAHMTQRRAAPPEGEM